MLLQLFPRKKSVVSGLLTLYFLFRNKNIKNVLILSGGKIDPIQAKSTSAWERKLAPLKQYGSYIKWEERDCAGWKTKDYKTRQSSFGE